MITTKEIMEIRPDIIEELRHMVNNYIPKNTLKSLQVGLNSEYIDTNYVQEKINALRRDADALQHDLDIVKRVVNGEIKKL